MYYLENKLSVIIPFRCENEHSTYLVKRLDDLCSSFPEHSQIEFICGGVSVLIPGVIE